MSNEKKTEMQEKKIDLGTVIATVTKMPGVKVNREAFLKEQFKDLSKEEIACIVEKGPVDAGQSREALAKKASRIIKERTAVSSAASLVAGLPGGMAVLATLPADIVQFYAVALRMAQELVYLYGEKDLWCEATDNYEHVNNQLILYCGVMLGASGADATVKVLAAALAKQALNQLPKKALTKTFYFPAIRATLKFFGIKLTKSMFGKGVSKVVPILGGVVSGGITLASMLPMGKRLAKVLDKAHFDYSEEDFEKDINIILELSEKEEEDVLAKIENAKALLDEGVITEGEFLKIKEKLLSEI